ncbi:nitrite reductase (NAD(P)H) small subunit [Micromonospora sp. NPDC000316]|uniref:nitrite reductase (NAD(P)H) small subunit n=1 Tax=Micromonospora sp. NPDC000316 TaxID=3364216 RepID=UPI00367BF1D0
MTDGAWSATRPGRAPREAATHCPYCALQCGMTLRADDDGVTVLPRQFPTNRGGLCQKGWTAAGVPTVAPPLHRQVYDLRTGACLDLPGVAVTRHDARCRDGLVEVRLRREG